MGKGLAIAAGVLLCAAPPARAGQAPIGSMPISASAADLAAAAGLHRVDPSTLPLDIVRMAFASPEGTMPAETRIRAAVAQVLDRDGAAAGTLPLPLGSAFWTRVVGRAVPENRLAATIFSTGRTALIYHGLMGAEPATLAWIEANPPVVDVLNRHPGVSAVYARSIRIRNGRIVTPGEAADEVWAALVGADPGQPVTFVAKLFSGRAGRLAAFYDAIAHLNPPQQAFAIGRTGGHGRIDRARRLLDVLTRHASRWRIDERPFMHADVDGAFLLRVVAVSAGGDLAPPASRAVWSRVFGGGDRGTLDAASLADIIFANGDLNARHRLDVFLFGQRAVGSDPRAGDAELVEALKGFRLYPLLMLTLERYGLAVAEYAAAARAAAALDGDEEAIALFQGGLAIVDRASRSGTIDEGQARTAISTLVKAAGGRASRAGLLAWIRTGLLDPFKRAVAGAAALDADAVVLAAMAGPRGRPGPIITWEGQQFRADPASAEFRRLSAIRRTQEEPPLDAALAAATPRNLTALAHSIAAIVYADALGEPGGQPTRAGQVWRRHRFAGSQPGQPELPVAWHLAKEVFADEGWHLVGSLLRLNAALAPLSLRRLDATEMPVASLLSTRDRRILALSVALIDPRSLSDDARDAITAALARGRGRAAGLSQDPAGVDAVADTAGLSEWRRNAARWTLATQPERVLEGFTLLELFRLGDGVALPSWGAAAAPIDGCLCLRFPERAAWEEFAGRPATGQLATQLPDVMLRTAEALSTRRLPAVLARDVAALAMQEVLDRARPAYFDDLLPIAFVARDLRDDQFDDYVAALTVAGPLVPVRGAR